MSIKSFEASEVVFYDSPSLDVVRNDSSYDVQAFNEKQNFQLPQDIALNSPDNWNQSSGKIPRGTAVDSHYIWFKPQFVDEDTFFRATATITFDNPIIGLIGGNQELLNSNDLLGVDGMVYPDNKFGPRQMDNLNPNGSKDIVVANGNVLTFDATARDGVDPVRVLTAAFPATDNGSDSPPNANPSPPPPSPSPPSPSPSSPPPPSNPPPSNPSPPTNNPSPPGVGFAALPVLPQAGASNPVRRQIGTKNNNVLRGNAEQNLLVGRAGNDRLKGKGNDDTIKCGRGIDRAFGGAGNDLIKGGRDNDRLFGGAGFDLITGNGGNDVLNGRSGDDILVGGLGNDTLTGGSGNDLFIFRSLNEAVDTIQDFTIGQDLIDLRRVLTTTPAAAQFVQFIQLAQVGANTELRINADGIGSDFVPLAVLRNTTASRLDPANFVVA